MEGDAPVLMATTPLAGILYVIKEDHAGSLAATTSPAMGAGGRSGFMAGKARWRPLAGILYVIKEDHAGSLAATTSPAMGAGGRSGFMAGMHGCRPCAAVPHCGGALTFGISVVAFPARAKAA